MNHRNVKPRGPLSLCPKCGMDSGRRVVSETIPERFFVICDTCGFHTKGHSMMGAATYEWNRGKRLLKIKEESKHERANCMD